MGWKQSVIPQYHVCTVPQCRPEGTLQLCAALTMQNKLKGIIWNICVIMALFCLGTSGTSHCPAHFHPSASPWGASWVKQLLYIGDQTGGWSPVKGNQGGWYQLFLLFPNPFSVTLVQPGTWAIAFRIVPARAVFAVLDALRLFSQQSATSYLSKEEISPTLFACVLTFWFPYSLFFKCTKRLKKCWGFRRGKERTTDVEWERVSVTEKQSWAIKELRRRIWSVFGTDIASCYLSFIFIMKYLSWHHSLEWYRAVG